MTRFLVIALIVAIAQAAHGALRADELALLVNRNSPEGKQLAEFYAESRTVPAGRIIELDLPLTDEISFDQYEQQVVPAVRQFLESHELTKQVRSIVTFYGVPLKIAARVNSEQDAFELKNLRAAFNDARQRITIPLTELERRAVSENPTFQVQRGDSIETLARRLDRASQALMIAYQQKSDEQQRQLKTTELTDLLNKLRAAGSTDRSDPATAPSTQPVLDITGMTPVQLADRRFDPAARRALRAIAAKDGIISFARVLEVQIDYLTPDETDAAFDSELALLWWPNYPRGRWMLNAAGYAFVGSAASAPPVIMTMRLDAPTPQIVHDLIETSIKVERTGLRGGAVIDAGGAAKLDPEKKQPGGAYWPFEERLVRLASLLKKRTKLSVKFDQSPEILPPKSVADVAIYTGWYNMGHYIPSCTFSPGAVGYHVASFEMVTLHDTNNDGWCRGLLKDGVVATLGPVSEPYLHAFPSPEDFFPLLLTGKLSLAEVYWRSVPLASWKICMVGDPLYTPYRASPAMEISDLPDRLRPVFQAEIGK